MWDCSPVAITPSGAMSRPAIKYVVSKPYDAESVRVLHASGKDSD